VVYIGKRKVPGRSRFDWEVNGTTDCVADDEAGYLLTNAGSETGDRFAGLEVMFDPVTRGHLNRLGLAPGARCLAVGAGSGSIARWMADQVRSSGRVLAVDLDPRWFVGVKVRCTSR